MQQILDSLIHFDQELFLALNRLGQNQWDTFWVFFTNKESWIPLYALLLVFAICKLKQWQKILLFVMFIAILITIVDQSITSIFKPGFGRFRPCHDDTLMNHVRLVVDHCGGKYSFFSAHAANSFALATFFTAIFKLKRVWAILFFSWAFLVAYSRIYVGVHFPLDITIGALWGVLIARGLYFIWCQVMLLKRI